LRDRIQEDNSSRPAWAKSSQNFISTNGYTHSVAPVTPATQGSTDRTVVQARSGITTNAKRDSRVAQVVECLPNKLKGLSSTPQQQEIRKEGGMEGGEGEREERRKKKKTETFRN
jgi:hypothetical protein